MEPFLIFLIVIAVIGAIAYGLYAAAKRRKVLSAWARSKSLSFDASKNHSMDSRFSGFKCLSQGHSRYARNVMEGDWSGPEITAFDYHYATGSGKNRRDYNFSAVVLAASVPLKPLCIRREHIFDKVTEFFGVDDIDFESAEFSRKFFVKSPDKKWAYDVIHQRMMEYLLAAPEFSVQFDIAHVIAWRSRRFKPAEFGAAAEFIRVILDRLPEYLVKQQMRK